jgi:hypothetical protein
MGRRCKVCCHPARAEIDAALVRGVAYRQIASHYGMSYASVKRHKEAHLPAALVEAHEAREVARADSLLVQMRELQERALRILADAESQGDLTNANRAIAEARRNIELVAKLLGELQAQARVEVQQTVIAAQEQKRLDVPVSTEALEAFNRAVREIALRDAVEYERRRGLD